VLALAAAAGAKPAGSFAVNEYFGVEYDREPVSFDVDFDPPVLASQIGLTCDGKAAPCQVEVLAGTRQAVSKARVWTAVSFPFVETEVEQQRGKEKVKVTRRVALPPEQRHRVYAVIVNERAAAGGAEPAATVKPVGKVGGVAVAEVSNGVFHAKVPVAGATFDEPASPFELPGPVVSVSRDGKEWVGTGYLDSMRRVTAVACESDNGPVYFESRIVYRFEDGRTYRARVRLYAAKPYVQLVEDFDLGGDSRFIFNYGDWPVDGFFRTEDGKNCDWFSITHDDPTDDFVKIVGQKCLARMVVWSQFGYFRGKQEAIGLKAPDRAAADEQYRRELADYKERLARFPEALANWRKRPRGGEPKPPTEPVKCSVEETDYVVAGAPIHTVVMTRPAQRRPSCTPGGDATAVGAFYIRPDRWTRAKLNHVDLYMRPEVPGERRSRGVVGLAGARLRPAMEAWLVEGHREWAIFAVPSGDRAWLAKAHVREGVWPLDRIIRLPLVWNADGAPVRPGDTRPCGGLSFGGDIATVLHATTGRAGLQHFNGSNPSMRGGYAGQAKKVAEWAKANTDKRSAAALQKAGLLCTYMVGPAMAAYMAADDSAYPGPRAMMPWANPEALNPFYQGMENMNFNVDRYRSILAVAIALDAMGHPKAREFLDYCRGQLSMDLDRYVYPQSGCWEESLGYAGCILSASRELGRAFRDRGMGNFFADPRVIKAYRFWTQVLSPPDAGFGGMRVVPAIGDHGLSLFVHVANMGGTIPDFQAAGTDDARRLARQLAWSLRQRNSADKAPTDLPGEPADLSSRWLQGYGSVLRGRDDKGRESFVVVRAGQSWGHHHQDKGSLWGWFRNVHFFGDAAWGGPPGPTYWNPYKQGPASGTQIELLGVNNWPLPCKYPAPWIADEQYEKDFDYCLARCMYPYNPPMDLSRSTPVALRNGYDRQVLLVHPDLLIVRDNVETTCATIWRLHSYQVDGTRTAAGGATLASPQGVTGELAMVYPDGVKFTTTTVHDLPLDDGTVVGLPFGHKPGAAADGRHGGPAAFDTRSMVLRWDMPADTSATWTFAVHGGAGKPPVSRRLDEAGRVTQVTFGDGTRVVALMSAEPFAFVGDGIDFAGTVGLVIRPPAGPAKVYPIRAARLTGGVRP